MRPQMMVERSIEGNEVLDIPSNNYDIAGIPREQWSSSLFHCYSHIPSCFLSICCSACLWSQVSLFSSSFISFLFLLFSYFFLLLFRLL